MTSPSTLHERYEQLGVLGSGGAGAVYLVRDRTTGERIALKRLLHADAQSLLRLKREFRSLADVHHPNLVKLYELGQDATSAFFTMELLDGQSLKQYLDASWLTPAANDNLDDDARHLGRVLSLFLQLAQAVNALHCAGVLHHDLKPSNVMIVDGRVIVLDFGIAVQVGMNAVTLTQDNLASGTPAYMAPEQLRGELIAEPNDWYAFGVMLYEALSGVLPIEGGLADLLVRKMTDEPTPISDLVAHVPSEVADLCMGLLRRAPGARPTGGEVIRILSAQVGSAQAADVSLPPSSGPHGQPSTTRTDTTVDSPLFGREAELAQLAAVFRGVQAGSFAAVHVAGESGSGKTALVQHFTEQVARTAVGKGQRQRQPQPLVLHSRCYERETLPFKALDGAVDALVNHLLHESDFVVSHSLPSDIRALTQLFPILNRLPAMKTLFGGAKPLTAALQARAQAEAALRELLQRLAAQRPIVLWIDDLQWGDLDSVEILTSWCGETPIPHLMLVLSYRVEEVATSPCLSMLLERTASSAKSTSTVLLPALGDDHVRALCAQRLELEGVPAEARADLSARIAQEAGGSPFIATQLAALTVAQPRKPGQRLGSLSLEQLVKSRSSGLSNEARRMLNLLSIAGRPLPLPVALAATHTGDGARAVIHELRSRHLIRTREADEARLLEVYHDRLREVVQSLLSAEERLELERSLFAALHASGLGDSDWLHVLALAAGERDAALRYGLAAAERAREALAFERAAELYERCLALTDDPSADGGELWEKLALAYAHAGHGYKAATIYLDAARQVGDRQSLRFEREAASHLLCSGRYEEGEALVRRVLSRVGLDPPSSKLGQLAAMAFDRVGLAVRGVEFERRSRGELDFEVQLRWELLATLSMETAAYDPLRATLFQARCLRMALNTGEPLIIGRALCVAATMHCVSGSERGKQRADALLAKAEAISRTLDSSLLRTNLVSARAMCAFLTSRFSEAVALCDQAEHMHRTSAIDSSYYHRFTIVIARIGALYELCEYPRAELDLQIYLKEAKATGNINAELQAAMAHAWADIIAARTAHARERLDRQRAQLPRHGFGILHVLHLIAVLRIGCATGDYDWALDSAQSYWRGFQRSVVRMSEHFTMFAYEARGRLLLCRAARDGTLRETSSEVAAHVRVLARSKAGDGRAAALRLRARVAFMRSDRAEAQRLFAQSSAAFEAHGSRDQAACDRFALGSVTGGEEGQATMRDALAVLSELGMAEPLQVMRGYLPEMLEVDARTS